MIVAGCSDDALECSPSADEVCVNAQNIENKDTMLAEFAQTLSAALSSSQDVRDFLKKKALEQFDNNYDILYADIRESLVSGRTFEDILTSYADDFSITDIGNNLPLLNIYLTKIVPLGVIPEELDTSDDEIPTAVAGLSSTDIYVDGRVVDTLNEGELPDYHIFVVGENSRVEFIGENEGGLKSSSLSSYRFKNSIFDGTTGKNKSFAVNSNILGARAVEAYKYFYKDDNSIYQKALQRDYIYYGITPQHQSGSLNRSASEYIYRIKVDPKAYFRAGDLNLAEEHREDPYVANPQYVSVGHQATEKELINKMWSKGVYDLRFDIIKSTGSNSSVVYVPVRPEELWDFNIEHWYRHKTKFRHSRHHYTIHPEDFTAKDYTLTTPIALGKWDLSEEALYRYVSISEEDNGTEIEEKYTYDMTQVKSSHFEGDTKLSAGIGKISTSSSITVKVDNSETEKVTRQITVKKKDKSDELGKIQIYYYDPVIDSKTGANYIAHEYNTGYVIFSITAK